MRRFLKFLHTIGAIGLMGAMACLLVMLSAMPTPSSLAAYASMRSAMGIIATWIFLPSLALTLVAGLLAIAVNPGYQNAGWAWVKLATGVLVFESGLSVEGSLREEAGRSAQALASQRDVTMLAGSAASERNTLWVLLAIAMVNVVLGIWRPRFAGRADRSPGSPKRH